MVAAVKSKKLVSMGCKNVRVFVPIVRYVSNPAYTHLTPISRMIEFSGAQETDYAAPASISETENDGYAAATSSTATTTTTTTSNDAIVVAEAQAVLSVLGSATQYDSRPPLPPVADISLQPGNLAAVYHTSEPTSVQSSATMHGQVRQLHSVITLSFFKMVQIPLDIWFAASTVKVLRAKRILNPACNV